MKSLQLPTIPFTFEWYNEPKDWINENNNLIIISKAKTDLFIDPLDLQEIDSAPAALFVPPDPCYIFGAKVSVDFKDVFDAGVLHIRSSKDNWAKLCFEFSPQKTPTVVSVVTQGSSDDCNSSTIGGNQVFLRMAVQPEVIGFHYSLDGAYWNMVRYFKLKYLNEIRIGFSAQSPNGQGCQAAFSEIFYRQGSLTDFRNGE